MSRFRLGVVRQVDAAAIARSHDRQIGYAHIRDFSGRTSTYLGAGDVPVAEHVRPLRELPEVRWAVIEQDPGCSDHLGDMRRSLEFMEALAV